ncbi:MULTISPECIES: ester cyclase [unclassified Tenacibaculum]|uniref:ester cyclase n=1 Tax=unclassified Tenacibaculum TaxID=2635139 RepID=UPI001F40269C|nr:MULTISPECIES: ester cyclase [unclassified Tenacibaculum]MCF2873195.1 ester cyclase [Tenacibaculum sp. Cn5-1]MCF2933351.1 ester cyclase [Tenacibaculum sp. Cn5-34]MCG7510068.1 ester cyclase [Tenacibaculum sp. Cn5-46]
MNKTVIVLITSLAFTACVKTEKMNNRNEIAKQYYQILDNGIPEKMNDLLSDTLIDHDGHGGDAVEEIKGLTLALKNGFSNSNHEFEVLELIGNDKVFVRWRMTGKHTGEFFGVPATNKEVDFVGHDLMKIKNGKIIEIWHVENLLDMFEQMKSE